MTVAYRQATPEDIDALMAVRSEGWYGSYLAHPDYCGPAPADRLDPDGDESREYLTNAALGRDQMQLFVAARQGEIVGLVNASVHGQRDLLNCFYVRSDQRGNGVGTELLKVALQWLADKDGTRMLEINVAEHNTRPMPYYERLGFAVERRHCANWWGQNKAGDQFIYDTRMISPSAAQTLALLRTK